MKTLPISEIDTNSGQVAGLPQNYRDITEERYQKLKQSIVECPEMLELREVIVYPHEGRYVTIAGNMRLEACTDIGYTEVPVKILPEDTSIDTLARIAVLDNLPFGENNLDMLIADWSKFDLKDWGLESLPSASSLNVFTPNLEPNQEHKAVRQDQIDRTRDKMENYYNNDGGSAGRSEGGDVTPDGQEVICPSCYNTFYI